jgi:hypothetical protein
MSFALPACVYRPWGAWSFMSVWLCVWTVASATAGISGEPCIFVHLATLEAAITLVKPCCLATQLSYSYCALPNVLQACRDSYKLLVCSGDAPSCYAILATKSHADHTLSDVYTLPALQMGALLAADQCAFGAVPMIATGCIRASVCHTNNCPVGVASQREGLRARFPGAPAGEQGLI